MSTEKLKTDIVTPEATACYAKLLVPEENQQGVLKYSVCLAIDRNENIGQMNTAIHNAVVNKWGKDKAKWPKNLKMPLRDGNEKEKDLDFWSGKIFVNASTERKPSLVDVNLNPIIDPDEVYSGMIIRAAVNFYAFDRNGNRGVACGLNHVMKVKDGERLSGGPSVEDAFAGFAKPKSDVPFDVNGGDLDFLS